MSANPGSTQRTAAAPIPSPPARAGDAPPGCGATAAATDRPWRSGASGRGWFPRAGWLVVLLGVAGVFAACRTHYQKQPATVDPQTAVDFRPGWQVGKRYLQRCETTTTATISKGGAPPEPSTGDLRVIEVAISVLEKLGNGGFDIEIEFVRLRSEATTGTKALPGFDSETDPAKDPPHPFNVLLRQLSGARIRCLTDRHGQIERITFGREWSAYLKTPPSANGLFLLRAFLGSDGFSDVLSLVGALPERPLKAGESWSAAPQSPEPPDRMPTAPGPFAGLRPRQIYTAAGFEKHEGRNCAVVAVAGTITPADQLVGRPPWVGDVNGTATGKVWFDLRRGVFRDGTLIREVTNETTFGGTNRIYATTQRTRLKLLELRDLTAAEFARKVPASPATTPSATAPVLLSTKPANPSVPPLLRRPADETFDLRPRWPAGRRNRQRLEIVQENETTITSVPQGSRVAFQYSSAAQTLVQSQEYMLTVQKAFPGSIRELELEILALKIEFEDGGRPAISFDSLSDPRKDGTNTVAAALRRLIGMKLHYRTDANGRVIQVIEAQELRSRLAATDTPQVMAVLRNLATDEYLSHLVTFPIGPPGRPVGIGDSWMVQPERSVGPVVTLENSLTNTFTGWVEHEQRRCALLDLAGTFTKTTNPSMTMRARVEHGKSSGRQWFDPAAGLIVDGFSEQETSTKFSQNGNDTVGRTKSTVSVKVIESRDLPKPN